MLPTDATIWGCVTLWASPQVPIHALWNDGRENLLGALLMAGQYAIPEVPSPSLVWGTGGLASGAQARGLGGPSGGMRRCRVRQGFEDLPFAVQVTCVVAIEKLGK